MTAVKHFEKNTVGNDYVVSDVHGMFNLLQSKLDELHFNPEVDRLFCGGDSCDRGTESEKCLEWFNKPWFHSVRGNHEQMIIDAYREEDFRYTQHSLQNGGGWFFALFEQDKLAYVEAFEALPYLIEVETDSGLVGIVHAEVENNSWDHTKTFVNMNEKYTLEKCLWARTRIKSKETTPIIGLHKLYVGHTPMKEVTTLGNVIYVDTGAVYGEDGGFLTILKIN
jgi:serine/threonine protein phosphatase 1